MSEENNDGGGAAGADDFKPITSQEDLDRAVGQRLARERAKFADYEDLKTKAAKFDEAETANKTELQKAQDAAKAADERAAKAEQAALRADVAAAKGVPANALTGSSREEMEKSADELIAWRGTQQKATPSTSALKSGSAAADSSGLTGKQRAAALVRQMRGSD